MAGNVDNTSGKLTANNITPISANSQLFSDSELHGTITVADEANNKGSRPTVEEQTLDDDHRPRGLLTTLPECRPYNEDTIPRTDTMQVLEKEPQEQTTLPGSTPDNCQQSNAAASVPPHIVQQSQREFVQNKPIQHLDTWITQVCKWGIENLNSGAITVDLYLSIGHATSWNNGRRRAYGTGKRHQSAIHRNCRMAGSARADRWWNRVSRRVSRRYPISSETSGGYTRAYIRAHMDRP